jgi:hypothetical protein
MEIMNRRKRINGHRRIKRTPIRSFDLHPAPDRVLSNAARDAKMANVPHDYTDKFNYAAEGISKGMISFGESVGAGLKAMGEKAKKIATGGMA